MQHTYIHRGRAAASARPGASRPRCLSISGGLLKDNVASLAPSAHVKRVSIPEAGVSFENQEGKRASIAIYAHLASKHGNLLSPQAAAEGLELYGEVTEQAREHPGSHPNIDLLLQVVENGSTLRMVVEQ